MKWITRVELDRWANTIASRSAVNWPRTSKLLEDMANVGRQAFFPIAGNYDCRPSLAPNSSEYKPIEVVERTMYSFCSLAGPRLGAGPRVDLSSNAVQDR
jgi:hypothetical protein